MKPECSNCGVKDLGIYHLCDRSYDQTYCSKCFAKHPCGLGKHGEGCPTEVFDDGKENEQTA